ncbi:hypothetical protein QBC43DRAFT_96261 [Cladorrhinum sp. PSN259]|nr:hypothetical protein QBC43DRAFT_96261 [Cladorrhinum sp. PSN259]
MTSRLPNGVALPKGTIMTVKHRLISDNMGKYKRRNAKLQGAPQLYCGLSASTERHVCPVAQAKQGKQQSLRPCTSNILWDTFRDSAHEPKLTINMGGRKGATPTAFICWHEGHGVSRLEDVVDGTFCPFSKANSPLEHGFCGIQTTRQAFRTVRRRHSGLPCLIEGLEFHLPYTEDLHISTFPPGSSNDISSSCWRQTSMVALQ